MKRVVSSLCAFALAFSLYGVPATAFAQESADGQDALRAAPETAQVLPEDAAGPVKVEASPADEEGAQAEELREPVFNEEADGTGAAPEAEQASDGSEDPSLLESIVDFFTGGGDPGDEEPEAEPEVDAPVQIDKSRQASGASLEVTFRTGFPKAMGAAADPLTLTVGSASAPFAISGGAGTIWTATLTGIAAGAHDITITGAGHLPLTHRVEFKDGIKHAFGMIDDAASASDEFAQYAGLIPYGDFDGNGAIDDEDSRLIAEAYVTGSTDLRFDMTSDGAIGLKDVQVLTACKGQTAKAPARVTESPDGTQVEPEVPEGTSIVVDGVVLTGDAAKEALLGLSNGAGAVVGLTNSANMVPGATKQPVSEDAPVELPLETGGLLMDRITLYAPIEAGTGASMPLAGTLDLKFERDGEDHELSIPIPCDSRYQASDPDLLPGVSAIIDRGRGYVHVDLGENVKVWNADFAFTEAAGPDDTMVRLKRIAYAATTDPAPDQPDPIEPEPVLPTIPEGFEVTKVADRLIEVAWAAAQDAVGYEVEVSIKNGKEPAETRLTTSTSLAITTFAGKPLENGVVYVLRVQAVSKDDAKSGYGYELEVAPELTTPPANPDAPQLTAGYCEITATWNAVDRADSYTLCYAKAGSSEFRRITTTDTTKTVRGLENKTDYTFYVVANNDRFGSSDKNGTPPRATARTTYVTTKVPWFNLINRTVQDKDAYLPTDVFKSVKAGGSEEEGAKLVDGDYNTTYEVAEGKDPVWSDAASVVFRSPHRIREMAVSTNLGQGYAEGILDVGVMVSTDSRLTKTFDKRSGITWKQAPTRDGVTSEATNTIMVKLPEPISNVRSVDIIIKREDGAQMTISELAFYEATTLEESIEALFKLGSLKTELAQGVDAGMIQELRDLVNATDPETLMDPNVTEERYWDADELLEELDMAANLLEGQDARVVTTRPEIYGATEQVRGTNAWQPTGSVAYAGTKVQVLVTPVSGMGDAPSSTATELKLIYAQHRGSESALSQSLGYLNLGANSFTLPERDGYGVESGGALYVEYERAGCPAYEVKVIGGQQVPLLDLHGVTDNIKVKQACVTYAAELTVYADRIRSLHAEGGHEEGFNEQLCIANATEVVTDNALISVPATLRMESFAQAQTDRKVDGASALSTGLPFTDKMIALLYQQAGLFDASDAANASAVAAYGANNALPTTHMAFRYMVAGSSGMKVTANAVALDWYEAIGLGTAPELLTTADGRYRRGTTYGWDLSRLVASAISFDAEAFPQVLTDYYAQLVTSRDGNMIDGKPAQHFSYDDVIAHLNAGVGGKLDDLSNDLGIAVLWQLHLAYDEGYSYTMFDSADALMDGSLFARMNAYVRNPAKAPAGLVLDGVSADDAFIRLACAASGKDLTSFFTAWGIPFNAETAQYAATFPAEPRALQYMDDDSHKKEMAVAQADVQQVAATVQAAATDDGCVKITGIALRDGERVAANQGFEVLRQVGADESTRVVVGFVPAGQASFTDRLTSDNGQTLMYSVRAVDTALMRSDATMAGEVQADFPRNLNKAYWTVTSTMESADDPAAIVDGSTATAYQGTRVHEAAGALGGAVTDPSSYASITIAFNKRTDACGIRYFPGADAAATFKRLWVQVSDDGVNWTSVGYKEIGASTFATSSCATVYFTRAMVMPNAAGEGSRISVQSASYLRVSDLDAASDDPISIAELDVIGSLPDAVSLDEGDAAGIGRVDSDITLRASADGIYDGAQTVIPAGSLVVSGSYVGNPAKSTLILRDALGAYISEDAKQVILAGRDLGNSISYSASGRWIVYFEPGTWEDAVSEWSFIGASLHRSNAPGDEEGVVMTASCPTERIPFDPDGTVAPFPLDLGTWM